MFIVRLIAATATAAALSLALYGCSAATKAELRCVTSQSLKRCAPACLGCVKTVVQDCQGAASTAP